MALSAMISAAMAAAGDGSGSRFIHNARALWLARLMEEDDDSDDDESTAGDATAAAGGDLATSTPLPLPLPPMALPAALVTPAAPAASMVVDLTSTGDGSDSSQSSRANATTRGTTSSRPFVQTIDDDDESEDDPDDVFMIVTDSTPPQQLADHVARKRPRSEMTTSRQVDPEVVVVETKVVERAQATECTVCCDPCTVSGPHRLVALKCGHLYGKQCIERWILVRPTLLSQQCWRES